MKIFEKNNRDLKPGDVSINDLEGELKRVNRGKRFRVLVRSTFNTLLVVAAVAVLVAVLFMPVMRIYGTSMTPTLDEGEIVISIKTKEVKTGDILGVYYGNKLLIKRCIAADQQWVDMNEDGDVFVDGVLLDEPYLMPGAKHIGPTNIALPYQVPDEAVFVMGDHRETSVDSRNTAVGCIDKDNIVGKIIFRVWPLEKFGIVDGKKEN